MNKYLRAKVKLEVLNPQKHEARFPENTGLALGKTVEECIEEAKSIYNNKKTMVLSIEVFIGGKLETITLVKE